MKFYCAIHAVSESMDHYNFALSGETINDVLGEIKKSLNEEIHYIGQWYVTVLGSDQDKKMQKIESKLFQALSQIGSQA